MITKTRFYSCRKGPLCKGCRQCVRGEKLVLFITGRCSQSCFYCPLSEEKKNKDVIYANERPIKDDSDEEFQNVIKESRLCDSKGAGITGGDPLAALDRTIKAIHLLKKGFGEDFHIHLYAPLKLVTKENMQKLREAGLDEIRFHPDLTDDTYWGRLNLAKGLGWDVGVEIPVIPLKEYYNWYLKLIDYLPERGVDFLNLNELEYSDTNAQALEKHGLHVIDEISYAIKGSAELAKDLMKKSRIPVHFCTAKLKDKVQLSNRIKRRSKNAKEPFDRVDREGMLIRGAVYLDETFPGVGYREKLNKINNDASKRHELMEKLEKLKHDLMKAFKISPKMIKLDKKKLRVLTSESIARKIGSTIYHKAAVVTEFPTWDQMEVEVEII